MARGGGREVGLEGLLDEFAEGMRYFVEVGWGGVGRGEGGDLEGFVETEGEEDFGGEEFLEEEGDCGVVELGLFERRLDLVLVHRHFRENEFCD